MHHQEIPCSQAEDRIRFICTIFTAIGADQWAILRQYHNILKSMATKHIQLAKYFIRVNLQILTMTFRLVGPIRHIIHRPNSI